MTVALAQRAVALAGIALLAALAALALASLRSEEDARTEPLPEAVPAPDGGWYRGLAGPQDVGDGRRTACGLILTPASKGVAHPVLPCGTKLYIAYGDVSALTQVVSQGPLGTRRQFGLTTALARDLGLRGVRTIRWRFARPRRT